MNIDELRNLDPKDIANWPASLQLGSLAVLIASIVTAGYFFILEDQNTELEQGRAKEGELKQAYVERKTKAINLDAYRQQLAEIQESFGALLKQLPSKAEMETLITEINQSGVGRGLQFELFKPAVSETKTAEFAERPIEIKLAGSYNDLAAFASDVSQLSRIVTLGNMQIAMPAAGATSNLSMQAVASTYRALDAEEATEIRRNEAAAKKKN
jgi:type IV pilus assembly protein PilO